MTDPGADASLTTRLLAALLVRDSPMEQGVSLLNRLGLPLEEIAIVMAGATSDGTSQRETIEKLGALGFDANAVVALTGFSKASVGPVLSRYRASQRSAGPDGT